MSEVRFRHDRRQIILPVAILSPDTRRMRLVRTDALLDTGASLCGLDARTISELELPHAGKVMVTTPTNSHVARTFRFRLGLYVDPEAHMPLVMDREFIAIESHPGERFDTLIGMNVLGAGTLHIDIDGTGSFRFEAG